MFEEFLEPNEITDRSVQWALREMDESLVAAAMVSMDEPQRDIVYRNVSERVRALLPEEISRAEEDLSPRYCQDAAEAFERRIRTFRKYVRENANRPLDQVKLDFSTPAMVLESFRSIQRLDRLRGAIAMEGAGPVDEDRFSRKALELVDDGWDPVTVREILTRLKATILDEESRRMEMIIDGVEALLNIEMPLLIEEKLAAHLSPTTV
jgi:hypothetical protein